MSGDGDFPLLGRYGVAFERLQVELKADAPTFRQGWWKVTLSPGVVDDAAKEWFGYGNCGLLAQALWEVSGWPMGVVEQTPEEGQVTWVHLGVIIPNDRFLDILGVRENGKVIQQYSKPGSTYRVRPITFKEGVEFGQFPRRGWRSKSDSISVETIRYFAHRLVEHALRDENNPSSQPLQTHHEK